jgi:GntR family transcriptional regulator, transcriptional repressor for pyruvate dehydrogenase complex
MPSAPDPTAPLIRETADAEPASGYDRVVDYLSSQLLSGALKVGDRLLPERELALRLGVGRPLVREALRSLAMIGVLDIRHGHGTIVRSPDASSLGAVFAFMLSQRGDLVEDILEVRIALERQAVRLACGRARRHDLMALAGAFDQIVATIDDPEAGGSADYEFHTLLVRASHAPALIEIYGVVSRLLRTSHVARRARIVQTSRSREFLIDHHDKILQAVRRGAPDEAEQLLMQHFEMGEELSQARAAPPD